MKQVPHFYILVWHTVEEDTLGVWAAQPELATHQPASTMAIPIIPEMWLQSLWPAIMK